MRQTSPSIDEGAPPLLGAQLNEGDATLSELTHWFASAECVFHLAHNGLKRGAIEHTQDTALLRGVWVASESLRNLFGQLIQHVTHWVQTRLSFEDWDMPRQTPDSVLSILLEDDRIPLVLDTIDGEIVCELEWLSG